MSLKSAGLPQSPPLQLPLRRRLPDACTHAFGDGVPDGKVAGGGWLPEPGHETSLNVCFTSPWLAEAISADDPPHEVNYVMFA